MLTPSLLLFAFRPTFHSNPPPVPSAVPATAATLITRHHCRAWTACVAYIPLGQRHIPSLWAPTDGSGSRVSGRQPDAWEKSLLGLPVLCDPEAFEDICKVHPGAKAYPLQGTDAVLALPTTLAAAGQRGSGRADEMVDVGSGPSRCRPDAAPAHTPAAASSYAPPATPFRGPGATPSRGPADQGIAYIMQTSGTSGAATAVAVPHRAIAINVLDITRRLGVSKSARVAFLAPITFDPSVVEVFCALSSGATLVAIPHKIRQSPQRLLMALMSQRVTIAMMTPTLLRRFDPSDLRSDLLAGGSPLETLVLGGEAFPSTLLQAAWPESSTVRVYNIYGVTEVSCWAMLARVARPTLWGSGTDAAPSTPSTPSLGWPLDGINLAVVCRPTDGRRQQASSDTASSLTTPLPGELVIHSESRACWVARAGEQFSLRTSWATGDAVSVLGPSSEERAPTAESIGGSISWAGRMNRHVKRNGTRLDLDDMERRVSTATGLPCLFFFGTADGVKEPPLICCLVETVPIEKDMALQLLQGEERPLRSGSDDSSQTVPSMTRHSRLCVPELHQARLRETLLPAEMPDGTIVVPELPLGHHGKVDLKSLSEIKAETQPGGQVPRLAWDTGSGGNGPDFDTSAGQHHLAVALQSLGFASPVWDATTTFAELGGDSLSAVQVVEKTLSLVTLAFEGLPERKIVSGKRRELYGHLLDALLSNSLMAAAALVDVATHGTNGKGRRSRPPVDAPLIAGDGPKRPRLKSSGDGEATGGGRWWVGRRGKACGRPEPSRAQPAGPGQVASLWRHNLGKCIDGTPLVVLAVAAEDSMSVVQEDVVIVGSHSHIVKAVSLATGGCLWSAELPDRVDSSAALSRCGRFVIIGCYDGHVYVLCSQTGATRWRYHLGDTVKSSPCVNAENGMVYCASHSGCIAALDVADCRAVWTAHAGAEVSGNADGLPSDDSAFAGVFATPVVDYQLQRVYIAALNATLLAFPVNAPDRPHRGAGSARAAQEARSLSAGGCLLRTSSPRPISPRWKTRLPAPVFSTPALLPNQELLVAGCVSGTLHGVSTRDGSLMWETRLAGPVYSSPAVMPDSGVKLGATTVVLGCHDASVVAVDCSGKVRWSASAGSMVYSSPCTTGRGLVVVATTQGTLLFLRSDGQRLGEYALPGQVFSSPVVVCGAQRTGGHCGGAKGVVADAAVRIVVGCRDNHLYCLRWSPDLGLSHSDEQLHAEENTGAGEAGDSPC